MSATKKVNEKVKEKKNERQVYLGSDLQVQCFVSDSEVLDTIFVVRIQNRAKCGIFQVSKGFECSVVSAEMCRQVFFEVVKMCDEMSTFVSLNFLNMLLKFCERQDMRDMSQMIHREQVTSK